MNSEMTGDTGRGPYPQFELCIHPEIDCKYKDMAGRCIYEQCLYDGDQVPDTNLLHFFRCVICHEVDAIDPREMKVHFCHTCIKRMNDAEVLPVRCKACGKTIDSPTDWIFSGLCQDCLNHLYDLIKDDHWKKLTRCYNCKKCPLG